MKKNRIFLFVAAFFPIIFSSCNFRQTDEKSQEDFEEYLQEKLSHAKKGDVIEIPEGKFEFTHTLSLNSVPFVSIRGTSQSKTVFSFKNQKEGEPGFKISNANNFLIENISILDTKEGGIRVVDSKNLIVRNVAIGWTEGGRATNGKYGISTVLCGEVLIEKCAVTATAGGGIYVSQTENAIIRNNITSENVAGINIENCVYADVYNNKSFENTVGLFISDQPGLVVKNGHSIRVFENVINENNLSNFASGDNSLAGISAGIGILLLSTREVEIFKNEFKGHSTTSLAILSFEFEGEENIDSLFNPYVSSIFLHHNKFSQPMTLPDTAGPLGMMTYMLFQENTPNILYDGFVDPVFVEKDGSVREAGKLCMQNNGDIKFANVNAPSHFREILTDPNVHDCELGELPSVEFSY